MAKVKIEEIIDHLESSIRKALTESIKKHLPDTNFNDREVFKSFKRNVSRRCSTWENVPDSLVKKE